ncbi:MAG: hypothetical protein IPO92_17495 [Saprospiraceae bacterium]|nr:hypothetical protein [Saprospiraceae bacterium]
MKKIKQLLAELGIGIKAVDFDRPWGGFFVIDNADTQKFMHKFYPEIENEILGTGLPLSPQNFMRSNQQKLSSQYHHRRRELWETN